MIVGKCQQCSSFFYLCGLLLAPIERNEVGGVFCLQHTGLQALPEVALQVFGLDVRDVKGCLHIGLLYVDGVVVLWTLLAHPLHERQCRVSTRGDKDFAQVGNLLQKGNLYAHLLSRLDRYALGVVAHGRDDHGAFLVQWPTQQEHTLGTAGCTYIGALEVYMDIRQGLTSIGIIHIANDDGLSIRFSFVHSP